MEQNQNSSLFSLNLDAQNSYTLRSVASWDKVLGVVSIITAILCIIGGIIFQQYAASYSDYGSYRSRSSAMNTGAMGSIGLVFYVIMGLLYGISGMFALNAGNKINAGLKTNNMELLNGGFAGARNFFALWAILMIFFLIMVLIGLAGAAFM
ncbi:MAG: hypothetical protein WBB20_00255 [Chitinophagaceae bacterium]